MFRPSLPLLIFSLLACTTIPAQEIPKDLPRQDVVEVPAIGEGLCVSNSFQTNMVLQRDKPVAVWGWASPGEKVTVSFADRMAEATTAADRSWKVTLPAMPADATPRTMTVAAGGKSLTLENILVGDIWVLGGQSNMEFEITKVDDGMLEVVSANFPEIRLLTMPQGKGFGSVPSFERLYEWSDWSGRHFRKGEWLVCSPETVKEFSAIGYVFGRRLHMATRVPIGLIDSSIGGTTLETWTPEEVVRKVDKPETQAKLREWEEKIAAWDANADLAKRIEQFEQQKKKRAEEGKPLPPDSQPPSDLRPGPVAERNRPGHCFAGVIRPLAGLAVKGAVFHQGFNNCFDGSAGARMYYQLFGPMITAWRNNFGDPQMPFCIISLCTADEPQTSERFLEPMTDVGALIREAQYSTFLDFLKAGDKAIGFAGSFDLRKSWYHPQIKIPAGERAAKWAIAALYGLFGDHEAESYWLPPTIDKMETVDGTLRLTMSTEIVTKDDADGKMLGFAIAGDDRRFFPAEITYFSDGVDDRNRPKYQRNVLVLSSPRVKEPRHYRYAWARNPMGNLVNGRQVPLQVQRSDNWLPEETPLLYDLPEGLNPETKAKWQNINNVRRALQLADTERRILEAEATLAELKEKHESDRKAWEDSKAKAEEQARAEWEKQQQPAP